MAPAVIITQKLRVRHVTRYRYANPVTFCEHRMMFRPRDSHDLRLIGTRLVITPEPKAVRWMHDVFGNSVSIATFDTQSADLCFESEIVLENYEADWPNSPIADFAQTYPFSYDTSEIPDLSRLIERASPDPGHFVDLWARSFLATSGPTDTWTLLTDMARSIPRDFAYAARDAEGVQSPTDTLALRSGTCRDFALLMMEAVRSLGFAARFVSGYLYTPMTVELAPGEAPHVGGSATHAWMQVYLPGAGWVEFDPTNGLVGNRDLIRIAVVRDPRQAAPLAGSFVGKPGDFLGISVEVTVTRL